MEVTVWRTKSVSLREKFKRHLLSHLCIPGQSWRKVGAIVGLSFLELFQRLLNDLTSPLFEAYCGLKSHKNAPNNHHFFVWWRVFCAPQYCSSLWSLSLHVHFWHSRAPHLSSLFLFVLHFGTIASPLLARPLPARHTIFDITPFCQAASQWHRLSPLPFQHPLLSAAQSWSIYPPSHWSFSQTTQAKGRRGCRDVSQPVKQPASQLASQTQLFSFSRL